MCKLAIRRNRALSQTRIRGPDYGTTQFETDLFQKVLVGLRLSQHVSSTVHEIWGLGGGILSVLPLALLVFVAPDTLPG